jgi:hypothetical protein
VLGELAVPQARRSLARDEPAVARQRGSRTMCMSTDNTAPPAKRKPKYVALGYAWGHGPRSRDDLSLAKQLELASHKPLDAYVVKRTSKGWRWVPYEGRIGPQMAVVAEYVGDNPGCCKADAAWAAGLYMKTFIWGPIGRAISAGLITAEYSHRNRYRLFACGFDRRAYYGEIAKPEADGFWHPEHP